MVGYYDIPSGVCPFALLFWITPPTVFISTLKLGGQSDHEVVQCIFFPGYGTPNFDRVITLFNEFFVHTSFPDNSYSFHRIVLKLGGHLDHEVVQRILF